MKKTELPFDVEIPKDLWGRVRLACALRGMHMSWLSLQVGYSEKQAVINVMRQESVPRGDKLQQMAEILDVPMTWLQEGVQATKAIRKQMLAAQKADREAGHNGQE